MSVTLTAAEERIQPAFPQRKRWTREERSRLAHHGIIEADRYELIEGQFIQKMSKNIPHMQALALLMAWLGGLFGGALAIPEPSIDVSPEDNPFSEPEPDAIVLKRSIRELSSRILASDVALLVEVSDTTLAFDLAIKAALYARAGIRDYWVVDINARRIVIHRDPAEGHYQSMVAYAEDESVSCLAAPDALKRVSELL